MAHTRSLYFVMYSQTPSITYHNLTYLDISTRFGTAWKVLTRARVGRSKQAAVFKATPGITNGL